MSMIAEITAKTLSVGGGDSILSPSFVSAVFVGLASLVSAIAVLVCGERRTRKRLDDFRREVVLANETVNTCEADKFVTRDECKNYRCELNRRFDDLTRGISDVMKQLVRNEAKSEERAVALHRRLDPILERVARTMGEVEIIKKRVVQ